MNKGARAKTLRTCNNLCCYNVLFQKSSEYCSLSCSQLHKLQLPPIGDFVLTAIYTRIAKAKRTDIIERCRREVGKKEYFPNHRGKRNCFQTLTDNIYNDDSPAGLCIRLVCEEFNVPPELVIRPSSSRGSSFPHYTALLVLKDEFNTTARDVAFLFGKHHDSVAKNIGALRQRMLRDEEMATKVAVIQRKFKEQWQKNKQQSSDKK